MIAIDWSSVEWSSLGSIVAGVGALFAAGVALESGRRDRRNANKNAEADRSIARETLEEVRREADVTREQVAEMRLDRESRTWGQLSLRWVPRQVPHGMMKSQDGIPAMITEYRLNLINTGGPVWDVTIFLTGPVGDPRPERTVPADDSIPTVDYLGAGLTVEPYNDWENVTPYSSRDALPASATIEYSDGLDVHNEVSRGIEVDTL